MLQRKREDGVNYGAGPADSFYDVVQLRELGQTRISRLSRTSVSGVHLVSGLYKTKNCSVYERHRFFNTVVQTPRAFTVSSKLHAPRKAIDDRDAVAKKRKGKEAA